MDVVVNPPKPGDESYELFMEEKSAVLQKLKNKAKLVVDTFNAIDGVSCQTVQGAMYAFPQISLPEKFINEAKSKGETPDSYYCSLLLEETGICVVPGSGFRQKVNIYLLFEILFFFYLGGYLSFPNNNFATDRNHGKIFKAIHQIPHFSYRQVCIKNVSYL